MKSDQRFWFGYGDEGLLIEGKDGEDIVLEVPWEFLPAFARIVTAFAETRESFQAAG